MHNNLMEKNFQPNVDGHRRLNPNKKKLVRSKVLKLLDAGVIYLISNSAWIDPIQFVLKKSRIMVVQNKKNTLIPTRTVT